MPFNARKVAGATLNTISIPAWDNVGQIYNYFSSNGRQVAQLGDKIHKTARRLQTVHSIDELYKKLDDLLEKKEQYKSKLINK